MIIFLFLRILESVLPILLSINAFLFNTSSKAKEEIEKLAENDIKFNHLEGLFSL